IGKWNAGFTGWARRGIEFAYFTAMNKSPRILQAAAAGLAATVPMTIFMARVHQALPRREQYPLPPRQITEEALEVASLDDDLSERRKRRLSLVAHFSYGCLVGAGFSVLPDQVVRQRPIAAGVVYGLAVWA